MAGCAYSIYLFHFLIIYGIKHLTAPLHLGRNFWLHYGLQSYVILPVVMLFCGSFFRLMEEKCAARHGDIRQPLDEG